MAGRAQDTPHPRTLSLSWQGKAVQVAAWERRSGAAWILFVPGLGCSKRSFHAAFTGEPLRAYSLLALDLVGFGESSRSADFHYDLIDQAEICAQVIDGLGDRPIHLVAHSLGGTVACLLPAAVLARLQSLVLVEGRLVVDSCSYSRLVSQLDEQDFVQRHYPAWRKRFLRESHLAQDLEEADPQAVYRSACSLYRRVRAGDLPARLAACPGVAKVFLYGDKNRSLGEREAVAGMPSIAIPQAGHFPMQDNPTAFYAALADVIARC